MKSMLSCGKRVNSNLSKCHIRSLLLAPISIETDWPLPAQVRFRCDRQWYAAIPQLILFLASRLSSTLSLSFVFQCDQCTEYVILLILYNLYIIYTKLMVYHRVLLALLCGILLSLVMIFAIDWIILRSPCQEQNDAMGSQGLKWGNQIHVWQCLIWIAYPLSIDRTSFSFKCRIPRKGSGFFGAKGFKWF